VGAGSPTSTAFSSAPEGLKPFAGTGALVGYQPSMKYWRTRRALPAAIGVAMEVPLMKASWKLLQEEVAGLLFAIEYISWSGNRRLLFQGSSKPVSVCIHGLVGRLKLALYSQVKHNL
jgi:hypothetical protein